MKNKLSDTYDCHISKCSDMEVSMEVKLPALLEKYH